MKKGYTDLNEEKVVRGTGKPTKYWDKVLDKFDVKRNGHTLTARYLIEKHKLSG